MPARDDGKLQMTPADCKKNSPESEVLPQQECTGRMSPVPQAHRSDGSAKQSHSEAHQRRKRITSTILFDIFCLAWIAPIAVALFLNFSSWIIGAGVGCRGAHPPENCFPDILGILGPGRHQRAASLDREDRENLAALQLVAKVLETWFVVVAASIVFDVTMWLAGSDDGIPLGYLFDHVSFPDVLMLFKGPFWTSCKGSGRRTVRPLLALFVALVVLLCVVCNLMGPAVAILIIPQLGWSEITPPATERFGQIAASSPPDMAIIESGCATYTPLINKTCRRAYSMSLDELSSGWKLRVESFLSYGLDFLPVVSAHDGVLFTFNATSDFIIWAPNRQVLTHMAYDYVEVLASQLQMRSDNQLATDILGHTGRPQDPILFDRYRSALDIVLHRKGPSIGLWPACARTSVFEQAVSTSKSVRCYNSTDTLVCFRVGSGWNETNLVHSRFSIQDTDTAWPATVSVDVYTVTKSIVIDNGDLGNLGCGDPASGPCDWDHLFSLSAGQYSNMRVTSYPIQVVEYSMPTASGVNITIHCENAAYLSFPDHIIDVSLDQNSIGLVQLELANDNVREPIYLHPEWIVAGWAVPPSGIVEGTRTAAANLVSALKSTGRLPGTSMAAFQAQHVISTLHALTLINFDTINVTDVTMDYDNHPLLTVSKSLRVWAYGCQTRTFKFAAAVSLFGCLVVLLRPVMSLTIATRRPPTPRLVVAALRNQQLGRLDGMRMDRDLGRVPLKVISHHDDEQIVLLHRDGSFVAPADP